MNTAGITGKHLGCRCIDGFKRIVSLTSGKILAACLARRHAVANTLIGIGGLTQRRSGMSVLTAGLLARKSPFALRSMVILGHVEKL